MPYLKNQHPYCIESCSLLNRLTEQKYGACPALKPQQQALDITTGLTSFESTGYDQQQPSADPALASKCSNISKTLALTNRLRLNHVDESALVTNKAARGRSKSNRLSVLECRADSGCPDTSKCCLLDPECPEHGSVCQKPYISSPSHLPSIPFNLTITERKKGKTVILSWDSVYNKNKPTIFVIEGRWSLKPPYSTLLSSTTTGDDDDDENNSGDSSMTDWGYMASTVNTNWVILRSINRGRWYRFRVGSVAKSGTFGFSQPTELFILSSPPKPPTQPQNLSVSAVWPELTAPAAGAGVSAAVSWLMPKRSDLPIVEYKLSWRMTQRSPKSSGDAVEVASSSSSSSSPSSDEYDMSVYENDE